MAKRLPYREGTWFALPLRKGGYAVGVVARMAPRGRIILAYFFGPKRNQIPSTYKPSGKRCYQMQTSWRSRFDKWGMDCHWRGRKLGSLTLANASICEKR